MCAEKSSLQFNLFITITAKLFIMKFLLLLLSFSALLIFSCKKDNTPYIASDPNSLEDATVVSAGKLSFSDERYDEGLAKIYRKKDGRFVLGLEQMNYESTFDTDVYLSSTPLLTTTSIKIFSAKKLHVNIYNPLSSGTDIPASKYVIIQRDRDAAPVATATLE